MRSKLKLDLQILCYKDNFAQQIILLTKGFFPSLSWWLYWIYEISTHLSHFGILNAAITTTIGPARNLKRSFQLRNYNMPSLESYLA